MRDRVSTKILDNGATRYGIYNEDGNMLRYEYIKLEDEPDEEGDLFNKANILPDSIPALLGLKMANPQVKDALNVLVNIGNVHVWSFTDVNGNTEFLTSTDPDAYPNGEIDPQPARYELGPVKNTLILQAAASTSKDEKYVVSYKIYESVSVDSLGNIVSGAEFGTYNAQANVWDELESKTMMSGRYIRAVSVGSAVLQHPGLGKFFFIPSTSAASLESISGGYACVFSEYQEVIGYPALNTGEYTYLGQIGDKPRIETGRYMGTGKYGSGNATTLTLGFAPKLLIVTPATVKDSNSSVTWFGVYIAGRENLYGFKHRTNYAEGVSFEYAPATTSRDGISWYSTVSADSQMNISSAVFNFFAIG